MAKPVGQQTVTVLVNVENEQIILASMMHDAIVLRDLVFALSRQVWGGDRHKVIFSILQEIQSKHLKFDLDLFYQLAGDKQYGGRDYVRKIFESFVSVPKNLDWHVEKLQVDAVKRTLRAGVLQSLVDATENPQTDLDDISEYVQLLNKGIRGHLSNETLSGDKLYDIYLGDLRARLKSSSFVGTGYDELDGNLTEGLARKKISVWTARPSIGKSTFLINVADRITHRRNPEKVLVLPLEMGTVPVLDTMVALRSGIYIDKLIKDTATLSRMDLQKANEIIKYITNDGNLVFWQGGIRIDRLARVLAEGGYTVAILDLYEKMIESLEQNVIANHLNRMQQLGKDTDCHLALVHQTRRGVEKRDDKRPTMEDLKNSGGYEEVADLIIGLNRGKYWDPDIDQDILEVGILKQRRGNKTKWVGYNFHGEIGKVGDYNMTWFK